MWCEGSIFTVAVGGEEKSFRTIESELDARKTRKFDYEKCREVMKFCGFLNGFRCQTVIIIKAL